MSRIRDIVLQSVEDGRPSAAIHAALEGMRSGPARERHAARRLLGWCAEHLPPEAWTAETRAAALQVGLTVEQGAPEVGVMRFPAVRGSEGRLIRVQARRVHRGTAGGIFCTASPSQRPIVEHAVEIARAATGHADPIEVSFDHHDWDGPSAGLAIAVAVWSAMKDTPLEPHMSCTGALGIRGEVLDVGHRSAKLRLLERPEAVLLTPSTWPGSDPRELPVGSLAEALDALDPRSVGDVDRALEQVRATSARGAWAHAARSALALLDGGDLEGDEPVEMLAIVMRASTATCSDALQGRCLKAAAGIPHLADLDAGVRLVGSAAVAAIDRLDLHTALDWLELVPEDAVRPHLRPHVFGPLAMVRILQGRREEALVVRRRSLELAPPSERARCLGDVSDVLRRLGRLDEALGAAEQAIDLAHGTSRRRAYQEQSVAHLILHHARALAALKRRDAALDALERGRPGPGIDPAFRYALLRAELLEAPALVDEACARLPILVESVPILRVLRWRTRVLLGLEANRPPEEPLSAAPTDLEAGLRIPY